MIEYEVWAVNKDNHLVDKTMVFQEEERAKALADHIEKTFSYMKAFVVLKTVEDTEEENDFNNVNEDSKE